jgi:uncharacterized coiled-coil DUF342 family protein
MENGRVNVMRGLLSEKDKLRTENATLHAKIEELRKEIDELRTAPILYIERPPGNATLHAKIEELRKENEELRNATILNISPTPIEDALDHEKQ